MGPRGTNACQVPPEAFAGGAVRALLKWKTDQNLVVAVRLNFTAAQIRAQLRARCDAVEALLRTAVGKVENGALWEKSRLRRLILACATAPTLVAFWAARCDKYIEMYITVFPRTYRAVNSSVKCRRLVSMRLCRSSSPLHVHLRVHCMEWRGRRGRRKC